MISPFHVLSAFHGLAGRLLGIRPRLELCVPLLGASGLVTGSLVLTGALFCALDVVVPTAVQGGARA